MRVLIACCALLMAVPAVAQEPAARGVLRVSVTASPSEVPLPYAVLSIAQLNIERFTDARGTIIVPVSHPIRTTWWFAGWGIYHSGAR